MIKYEYKILTVKKGEVTEEQLNTLGASGWQLVIVDDLTIVLKRKLEDD